jgi:hypothetical protein
MRCRPGFRLIKLLPIPPGEPAALQDPGRAQVPFPPIDRPSRDNESRELRLLRLLLLQIAILSITSACAGGNRSAHDNAPRATPAPRPPLQDSQRLAESLRESLDAMSERMAATGSVLPVTWEYTATSALDTGRLPEPVR